MIPPAYEQPSHPVGLKWKTKLSHRNRLGKINEIVDLQQKLSHLANILSFITRRGKNLGQSDDEQRISDPPYSPEEKHDLNTTHESVDEVEFEAPIISGEEDIKRIKINTLDRLAEVLAKFKTAKGGEPSDNTNRDAKHVTSLMMVESLSNDTITFFCTKHEGLDSEDVRFLQDLEHLYRVMAIKGKPKLLLVQYFKAFMANE